MDFVSLNNLLTSDGSNYALHHHYNIAGGQVMLLDHCRLLQAVLH